MEINFNFEEIEDISVQNGLYHEYSFVIFREISTDVLWVRNGNSLSEMHDPETGLPLTYEGWKEKYHYN